jgi:hypothetical protein
MCAENGERCAITPYKMRGRTCAQLTGNSTYREYYRFNRGKWIYSDSCQLGSLLTWSSTWRSKAIVLRCCFWSQGRAFTLRVRPDISFHAAGEFLKELLTLFLWQFASSFGNSVVIGYYNLAINQSNFIQQSSREINIRPFGEEVVRIMLNLTVHCCFQKSPTMTYHDPI